MSLESIKKLVEKLKTDREFSQTLCNIKNKKEKFKFLEEANFDVTYEEIILFRKELPDDILEILSDNISWEYILWIMKKSLYD